MIMAQLFNIINDTVIIDKLALTNTSGTVNHTGSLTVSGTVQLNSTLDATTINAETINVKNLVSDNGNLASVGHWVYENEVDLSGKGFTWSSKTNSSFLIYRPGNKLLTNANFELGSGSSYHINNIPVLSLTKLGDAVVESNLRKLGTLRALEVAGDATIGEFAFFNSNNNRLGIGTIDPNAGLSVVENGVEIVLGSPSTNFGHIGTNTAHDFGIITDGISRITVKNTGDVQVYGSLHVDGAITAASVTTDVRINRTHPLEFKPSTGSSLNGLGLIWLDSSKVVQLVVSGDQDRLWLSENFEIGRGKSYFVNGSQVLTADTLGESVVSSSLTSVGTLSSLNVSGTATVNQLEADVVNVKTSIDADTSIKLNVAGKVVVHGDTDQISIGDKYEQKPVKVFGPLSIGINNPDPSVNFSVNGDVKLGGKKFTSHPEIPTSGSYEIGDICWNSDPKASSYIGWVCVMAGDPGHWLPFGAINT